MVDEKVEAVEQRILELAIAISVEDRDREGRAYLDLGWAYHNRCDYQQAIKNYSQALHIVIEIGCRAREAIVSCCLGRAYFKLGNFKQAIEYHKKQLSINKEVGDRIWEGIAYLNLGNAYRSLGNFKKVIEYCEKYLSIAKEVGNKAWEESVYGNLGIAYHSLGNLEQAIEYCEKYLSIAQEVGNRTGEGSAYGYLGIVYRSVGNSKQAIEYFEKHLSIAKEVGDRAGEGSAYGDLGNSHLRVGNFKQAIEYYNKYISIAKEVGDRAGEGSVYGKLGIAHHSLGNLKQAIQYCEKCLSIAQEVGNRAEVGSAYGNIGIAYHSLGNFKQAVEYCEKHLSIAKEVGDMAEEGAAYGNLGIAYHSLGNLKQAIEYCEKHLSIAKEVGNRAKEGTAYGNLGVAYRSLSNFKQAIEYHEKHLSIAKEVGNRAGEGSAYGNLGTAYRNLGNFKQATDYYKKQLSIAKEVGNRAGEGSGYGNLGNSYLSLGNFKQAIEYYEKHLCIAKEIGDRAGERSYANLGSAYLNQGNLKKAMECHEHCLSIVKEIGDCLGEGIAWYLLGRDHELLGSLSNALSCYRSSIKRFDETRRSLKSEDEWKISFRDSHCMSYTALWRTLLKNGEIEEALYAAEKGRAQALMDILKEQYSIGSHLFSTLTPKQTVSAALKIERFPAQAVFVALDDNKITFWVLRKDSKISFRQSETSNGSADLFMKTIFKGIGVRGGVRCEDRSLDPLPSNPPCSRERFRDKSVLSSPSSENPLTLLYDVLIRPIVDLLHDDELIIVPDGPFCLAPYSALSESIRIRTIPSLTALNLIIGAPEDFHSKTGALLVGDPWLKEVREPILEQLPCAKEEVEMIGELLQTTPLTGRNATKAEVLNRMKSVALVHIAAHGCPETGEIALAPNTERESPTPKKEDFLLKMSDVAAVRLRARLVVLSCCHSGRGEVKSEGVVGIARAFLGAGARSVVVSLWAIDDEATLLFMRSFYQHLVDGKSASAALHQAMKSLRESKQYCAVKHWAPFVLVGDDVTLHFLSKK
ncbi:tetratricopeptide repeat protein 28-like [Montipora foliosa]|uniref:tetratricopeptide repeat protein 28-like n=1 Tax=Montipora foliosa TaxID=591990 RepID=UPI0035F14802